MHSLFFLNFLIFLNSKNSKNSKKNMYSLFFWIFWIQKIQKNQKIQKKNESPEKKEMEFKKFKKFKKIKKKYVFIFFLNFWNFLNSISFFLVYRLTSRDSPERGIISIKSFRHANVQIVHKGPSYIYIFIYLWMISQRSRNSLILVKLWLDWTSTVCLIWRCLKMEACPVIIISHFWKPTELSASAS